MNRYEWAIDSNQSPHYRRLVFKLNRKVWEVNQLLSINLLVSFLYRTDGRILTCGVRGMSVRAQIMRQSSKVALPHSIPGGRLSPRSGKSSLFMSHLSKRPEGLDSTLPSNVSKIDRICEWRVPIKIRSGLVNNSSFPYSLRKLMTSPTNSAICSSYVSSLLESYPLRGCSRVEYINIWVPDLEKSRYAAVYTSGLDESSVAEMKMTRACSEVPCGNFANCSRRNNGSEYGNSVVSSSTNSFGTESNDCVWLTILTWVSSVVWLIQVVR